MYDVITLGSATVDVFAKTDSQLVTIKTANSHEDLIAYPSGVKIIITDLQFEIGGGGTNTAAAFSRLGFNTAYGGCIGNDENAQKVMQYLKKEKIDFIGTVEDAKTNYSIVLDSIEDDRTILVYKDASNKLKFSKLNLSKFQAKAIYSSSMLEESYLTLEKISDYAKKNSIMLAFNPSNYQAEWGLARLSKVFRNLDILVLNKEEAELLVGKGEYAYLLKNLQKTGPQVVVITDGKKGAVALQKDMMYSIEPKKVHIVETTGAGDAFGSSFVAGMLINKDVEFALHLAALNAESVISHYGSKNVLLTRKEALEQLKKDSRKVKKQRI